MARAISKSESRESVTRPRHDATINVRVPTALRDLIDNAAAAVGKTRSDFILESARQRATDVLLDQRLFSLDADQHAAFMSALEAPAAPNQKLKDLMSRKSPWE